MFMTPDISEKKRKSLFFPFLSLNLHVVRTVKHEFTSDTFNDEKEPNKKGKEKFSN